MTRACRVPGTCEYLAQCSVTIGGFRELPTRDYNLASNPIRPVWLPALGVSEPTNQNRNIEEFALRTRKQRDDNAQALEIAENGAGLGFLYWDLDDDQIACTKKCREHFGIAVSEPVTFQR